MKRKKKERKKKAQPERNRKREKMSKYSKVNNKGTFLGKIDFPKFLNPD
jgi:hypothetical protein